MAHALAPARDGHAALALPGLLLAALLATIGLQSGAVDFRAAAGAGHRPQTTIVAPRAYAYRAPGDFLRDGRVVDGPLVAVVAPEPLEIMTFQVSAIEYERCVAEGACRKAEPRRRGLGDVPATGVSHDDATDYARWLSDRTGDAWRLPTVAEWLFAAGSRAVDPALALEASDDPAERWLAAYDRESALGGEPAAPSARGTFGLNEHGVADFGGSVWEWTATCSTRTTLGPAGEPIGRVEACGVKVLEGRHRTRMSDFVRDAKSGGCSTGIPPDNLGFRLVRDPGPLEAMLRRIGL
jgi:formylglycine-generating enzyme required for sulfatase activity